MRASNSTTDTSSTNSPPAFGSPYHAQSRRSHLGSTATPVTDRRHSGTFVTTDQRRRFLILNAVLLTLALASTAGILMWNNPLPVGSDGFWRIAHMRATSLVVIALVVVCQSFATITFQTVTANRILTPSIMGFESLYVLLSTAAVFFMGTSAVQYFAGGIQFVFQTALMVVFSALLYGSLLGRARHSLHTMLLIGIIVGGGLSSLSTFMHRMLDPSQFDILTARLFGNIGNAETAFLPYIIPTVIAVCVVLYLGSARLNVLSLGPHTAQSLGIHHRRATIVSLFLISLLMSMTTSLVGPMTFVGFLIATLTYQLTNTHDHRLLFPTGVLVGYVVMSSAYFILRHIFPAQGAVTVVIELIGGLTFLIFIIRKGRL